MFDEINYSYLWNGAGYDVTPKSRTKPYHLDELEQYDTTGLFCMRVHYTLIEAAIKLRDYIKYRTHTEEEFYNTSERWRLEEECDKIRTQSLYYYCRAQNRKKVFKRGNVKYYPKHKRQEIEESQRRLHEIKRESDARISKHNAATNEKYRQLHAEEHARAEARNKRLVREAIEAARKLERKKEGIQRE